MSNLLETDIVDEHQKTDASASSEILRQLDFFFNENQDRLKLKKKRKKSLNIIQVLVDNRGVLVYIYIVIVLVLSLIVFSILGIPTLAINTLVLSVSILLLGLAVYLCWKVWQPIFDSAKAARTASILNAQAYSFDSYYEIIEELGENFYAEHLQREELRFQLIIEQRKRNSNIFSKGTALLSILFVVVAILIFGAPKPETEINLLFGTIAGFSGVSFVVKVAFDVILEWLNSQDIDVYTKCILILQHAQIIAKEEESDALRAYDEAVLSKDEAISFEEAIAKIEQSR